MTEPIPTDRTDDLSEVRLPVRSLRDAFGIGMELADEFGPEPFCAVWVGDPDSSVVDFLVLTDELGDDIDHVVNSLRFAAPGYRPADRIVLWRWSAEIQDAPSLAEGFFRRRDRLAAVGLHLLDEIILFDDDLRSMAITTFSDDPEWDDVTALLADDGAA